MTFVVDGMLGKLAKWLRVLGFDVVYLPRAEDHQLLRLAQKEGRAVLTRDTDLAAKAGGLGSLLIRSQRWEDQVRQVLDEFRLRGEIKPYSRCITCNARLVPLAREDARNLVPPFVFERSQEFSICSSCSRVYWPGTHLRGMASRLESVLWSNAEEGEKNS